MKWGKQLNPVRKKLGSEKKKCKNQINRKKKKSVNKGSTGEQRD